MLPTLDDPTPTGVPFRSHDFFGDAVALDAGTAPIGAPDDATRGTRIGQALLFDAVTGAPLETFDDRSPSADEAFPSDDLGSDVALTGDWSRSAPVRTTRRAPMSVGPASSPRSPFRAAVRCSEVGSSSASLSPAAGARRAQTSPVASRICFHTAVSSNSVHSRLRPRGPNSAWVMPMTWTSAPVGTPKAPQPSWRP